MGFRVEGFRFQGVRFWAFAVYCSCDAASTRKPPHRSVVGEGQSRFLLLKNGVPGIGSRL